jgi:phospholipase C
MLDRIQHVVFLMLENRSFDNAVGYAYRGPGDEPKHHIPGLAPGEPVFDGLGWQDTKKLANPLVVGGSTRYVPPSPGVGAMNVPSWDPHEDFNPVTNQLFGSPEPPVPGTKPDMKGFLADYASQWKPPFDTDQLRQIEQVMQMHTPADLPILNGLARFYALSDRWFSSVPSETNPNRAFSLAGTSMGRADNGPLALDRFHTDTIFNVLSELGRSDWRIFWEDVFPPVVGIWPYTRDIFPNLQPSEFDEHFLGMEQFFTLAETGRLPLLSYLEPRWTLMEGSVGFQGDDYHPPGDCTPGEALLARVYRAVTADRAAWEKTLLIVTFDEHGGTYDHVSPPWKAMPPWGHEQPGFPLEYDFGFDRFGVRVPALLISPWVEKETIFRSGTDVPFDHTSVLATLLKWDRVEGDPRMMGQRTACAPTFEKVLTRSTPRTDNFFDPKPPPPLGTVVQYGDPFYLGTGTDRYLTLAYSGATRWFAQLAHSEAISHDFRLGYGNVLSGAIVQVHTTELNVGEENFLGAWKDENDCYYFESDYTPDYPQQKWRVTRADGAPGQPLRYGDSVYLTSVGRAGQGLTDASGGKFLTTEAGLGRSWFLAPPRPLPPAGPVVKKGDRFRLRHMNAAYVVAAHLGRQYWPLLGAKPSVILYIPGKQEPVKEGSVIQLQSTEAGLGDYTMLGAWPSPDCYYYKPNYNVDRQSWRITKQDPGEPEIRYGEPVYLTNVGYNQMMVRDTKNTDYITTAANAGDWWVFEKT